jgi:anti-sigma-K factor RskA
MTAPTLPEEEQLEAHLRALANTYATMRPPPDLAAKISQRLAAQQGELSDAELEWLSAAGGGAWRYDPSDDPG